MIVQTAVEDITEGIDEAGELRQDKEDGSHALNPGELTFEDDVAGGLGRHLGVASTTFLMYNEARI